MGPSHITLYQGVARCSCRTGESALADADMLSGAASPSRPGCVVWQPLAFWDVYRVPTVRYLAGHPQLAASHLIRISIGSASIAPEDGDLRAVPANIRKTDMLYLGRDPPHVTVAVSSLVRPATLIFQPLLGRDLASSAIGSTRCERVSRRGACSVVSPGFFLQRSVYLLC